MATKARISWRIWTNSRKDKIRCFKGRVPFFRLSYTYINQDFMDIDGNKWAGWVRKLTVSSTGIVEFQIHEYKSWKPLNRPMNNVLIIIFLRKKNLATNVILRVLHSSNANHVIGSSAKTKNWVCVPDLYRAFHYRWHYWKRMFSNRT